MGVVNLHGLYWVLSFETGNFTAIRALLPVMRDDDGDADDYVVVAKSIRSIWKFDTFVTGTVHLHVQTYCQVTDTVNKKPK